MKVPKMYKSSDRYNAGTDVIYDDDSKLQYAPFIYATTKSGDSEGGGDDKEGDDTMVVIFDTVTNSINKSFKELKDAVTAGKIVVLTASSTYGGKVDESFFYLTNLINDNDAEYSASFGSIFEDTDTSEFIPQVLTVVASDDTTHMISIV